MAVVGLLLGLLGGGGSVLAVPLLTMGTGMAAAQAIPVSLGVVGIASLGAGLAHWRRGHVFPRLALLIGGTGMVGAMLGGWLSRFIPSDVLGIAFAGLMLVMGAKLIGAKATAPRRPATTSPAVLMAIGLGIGLLTGLLGVGGGFLIVPALILMTDTPMAKAIGTSSVVIAANALTGFAVQAYQHAPDWSGMTLMIVAALLAAQVGAWLGTKLAPGRLRYGFGWLVLTIGLVFLQHLVIPA